MTSRLRGHWSAVPLTIMTAILGLIMMQFFTAAPFGEGASFELGEEAAYLALSAASFLAAVTVHPAGHRHVLLWIAVGVAFAALFAANMAGFDAIWPDYPVADDIPTLMAWGITSLALLFALRHPRLMPTARAFLLTGFALQSLAFLADLGSGSLFGLPRRLHSLTFSANEVCDIMGLGAYLSGLLLVSLPLVDAKPGTAGPSVAVVAGERAFDWLKNGPVRYAAIATEEVKRGLWRVRRRDADFAAYYAGGIAARLDRGKSHRTLGRQNWTKSVFVKDDGDWSEDAFAERGFELFESLKSLGVTPASTVVDYGCGSLRIGQHFIRFLDAGHYWGLDVTDRFYRDGVELLGADMIAGKQPHLQVIADGALQAAGLAGPDLIYSIAVMKHVPAGELDNYWSRLLSMMGPQTTAVVEFQTAARNMRTGGKNWAYTEDFIRGVVHRHMSDANIAMEEVEHKAGRPALWRRARLVITSGL